MQKNLMVGLMVMMVLLAGVGVSRAAEVGKWEAYGGAGYNTYQLEKANETVNKEDINSGVSFLVGIRQWIMPKVAVGAEIESMEVSWEDCANQAGTTGYLGTVNYEVGPGLSAFGALGVYFVEVDGFNIDERGSNVGFKLGLEGDYDLNDKWGLQSRVGYRNNSVEVEDLEVDFSGFSLDGAVSYRF